MFGAGACCSTKVWGGEKKAGVCDVYVWLDYVCVRVSICVCVAHSHTTPLSITHPFTCLTPPPLHPSTPHPRSSEREERRRAAIEECTYMIVNPRGGCCTPLPYEAAVWLLEEEEELKGGSHSGLPPTTSGGGLMSPSLSYSGARSPMMLSFTSGSPMLGSGGMMRQAVGAGGVVGGVALCIDTTYTIITMRICCNHVINLSMPHTTPHPHPHYTTPSPTHPTAHTGRRLVPLNSRQCQLPGIHRGPQNHACSHPQPPTRPQPPTGGDTWGPPPLKPRGDPHTQTSRGAAGE